MHDKEVLHVFNKMDRLGAAEATALQERMHELLPGSVFVAATVADGLEPLRAALLARRHEQRPVEEFRIPISDGRTLAELYREGEVVEQRTEEAELVVRARVGAALAGKLRALGA